MKTRKSCFTYRRYVKVISLILAALMLSSALWGCGSSSPSTNQTSDPQEEAAGHEKTIRVSAGNVPGTDPGIVLDGASNVLFTNIYETLVFEDDTGERIPWLATKWETSEDGLTWTFELRNDVRFHNGDLFTAEDVVFSIERLITLGTGNAYVYVGIVDSAKAVNDTTVAFTLTKPFGPFLSAIAGLRILNANEVLSHQEAGDYGEFGDYGTKWLQTHDAGSGPYTISEVNQQEFVSAVKFDEYWGGWEENAPESIKISNLSSEPATVRTLIANRELEQTDWWLSQESVEELEKIEGVGTTTLAQGSEVIMLHTQKAPTDDVHFRKALAYLLDYNTAINSIFVGGSKGQGPVISSTPGFAKGLDEYVLDLEKAKEELALSKYANQLDQYPVEIAWGLGSDNHEKLALLFQSNLAELGIPSVLKPIEWGELQSLCAQKDTTPVATIMAVAGAYHEASGELLTRYSSSGTGVWSQTEWLENKQIDALLENAVKTNDEGERYAQYAEIQEELVALAPTLWVADLANPVVYQKAFVDWPYADRKNANQSVSIARTFYYHDYKVN